MAKLTNKQQRFIEEYLIDLNATQAAIRAGYSSKRASEQAHQLLQKTTVSECIDQALAERSKRTGINQDRVLQELARIAFINATDVIDTKTATVICGANKDDTAVIQSVKVKKSISENSETVEREIKLADKIKALELLGRHLGMYQNNLNVTVETSKKLDDIMSQIGGEGLEE